MSSSVVDGNIYAIDGGLNADIAWVDAKTWEPFPKGIVEEYDAGFKPQSVNPHDKLPSTWANIKSIFGSGDSSIFIYPQ